MSESFLRASAEVEKILETMAVPVDLNDDEKLVKIATTSLNSKVNFVLSDLISFFWFKVSNFFFYKKA